MVINAATQRHHTEHPVCYRVSAEPLASHPGSVCSELQRWHRALHGSIPLSCVKNKPQAERCCPRGPLFSLQLEYDAVISVQTAASAQAVRTLPGLVDLGSLEQRMGQTL